MPRSATPSGVQPAREGSRARRQRLDLQGFTCVAEAGVNRAMTRRFGRAPRGARGSAAVPQHDGANLTRIAALGLHGIEAVMTIAGATDAEGFPAYAAQVLGPRLRPGDRGVLDTLSAHKMPPSREVIEGRGARWRYVPPYSPELAPIEPAWAKLKTVVRTATARPREALELASQQALTTMTAADAHGWFTSCGYTVPEIENRSNRW